MKKATINWLKKHELTKPAGFFSPWESFQISDQLRIGSTNLPRCRDHLRVAVKSGEWHARSFNQIPNEDFDFMADMLAEQGKQFDLIKNHTEQIVNQITYLFKKFQKKEDIVRALIDLGIQDTGMAGAIAGNWTNIPANIQMEMVDTLRGIRGIQTKYMEYIDSIENLKKEEWLTKCFFFSIVHGDYFNDPRFSDANLRKTIVEAEAYPEEVDSGYFLGLFDVKTFDSKKADDMLKIANAAEAIANKPYSIASQNRWGEPHSLRHLPNSGLMPENCGFVVGCPWSDTSYTLKIIRNDEGNIIFIGSILYDEQ